MFTTDTFPGQSFDGIFYWFGAKGLNWDPYGHNTTSTDALATLPCIADANGYYKPRTPGRLLLRVVSGPQQAARSLSLRRCREWSPATLPNPNIFTNGAWYGGSPYRGPDANVRATAPTSIFNPSTCQANPANERGWAFMWHSHNEREITTQQRFPRRNADDDAG